jgi:hypothetical protein
MGTHAVLGVSFDDGSIIGCYIHYDGATMRGRIADFIEKQTTTALVVLIARAQTSGGMRSFHTPRNEGELENLDVYETDFLDDDEPYIIDEKNWDGHHFGAHYMYKVCYKSGDISGYRR